MRVYFTFGKSPVEVHCAALSAANDVPASAASDICLMSLL